MFEHIVQMGPMVILAGMIMGWVAEAVSRAAGARLIYIMLLSLIGSVVGGAVVWVVRSSDAGMLEMFLIGCAGGAVAIAAQRTFWRSVTLGT